MKVLNEIGKGKNFLVEVKRPNEILLLFFSQEQKVKLHSIYLKYLSKMAATKGNFDSRTRGYAMRAKAIPLKTGAPTKAASFNID